jgi:RNA polymerase sigma factor (TIGR02999 family)
MSEITRMLQAVQDGQMPSEKLLPLVYEELRRLAASRLKREPPGQTLQATALVHEAWLRVRGDSKVVWDGRPHFFAAAAEAMRRILVDNARRKQAVRHGAGLRRTQLDEERIVAEKGDTELLAVHEALDRLAAHDARKADLVKLRYFAGLTVEEAAEALGISEVTAKRDWAYARAWLRREIDRTRDQE